MRYVVICLGNYVVYLWVVCVAMLFTPLCCLPLGSLGSYVVYPFPYASSHLVFPCWLPVSCLCVAMQDGSPLYIASEYIQDSTIVFLLPFPTYPHLTNGSRAWFGNGFVENNICTDSVKSTNDKQGRWMVIRLE